MTSPDIHFIQHAIRLADSGIGRTGKNPSVGCVIVLDGQVIAAERTADGGRPHAENLALEAAGEGAKGATAYVTLEPCAHDGDTPPCAQLLIDAGVSRVVYACADPDARTAGKGIALLEKAGIEVLQVGEAEALPLYKGFFSRIAKGLPEITLKVATSLDGHIANALGESQWITGVEARREVHKMRSRHDAIVTGVGTVVADDPALTCRLKGLEHTSPIRVVLDRKLRVPMDSEVIQTSYDFPTWVMTTNRVLRGDIRLLEDAGVEVMQLPEVMIELVARELAARGINRIMIEAGQKVATHALQSGVVDHIHWFRAPKLIGEGGKPAFLTNGARPLSMVEEFSLRSTRKIGEDLLEVYSLE